MILSAKHGLLDPLKVIEPYDLTLNDLKRAECREWARSVHRQLIEGDFVRPESVILWLAGEKYQKDLRELLTGCRHKDPLSSMRIGQRLKFLTDALSADGRAVDPDGA